MNLLDLYTPEELAEKQASFLERMVELLEEDGDVATRARTVGHKLHGTGGNIGIDENLVQWGLRLQVMVHEGATTDALEDEIERLLPEIRRVLEAAATKRG